MSIFTQSYRKCKIYLVRLVNLPIFDSTNTANMTQTELKEWALALSCAQYIEPFDLIVSERPYNNTLTY